MEDHKHKMTLLLGEINLIREENRKLNSTLKLMINKYNDLRKHIKFLVQQKRVVDGDQVFHSDYRGKDPLYGSYSRDAVCHQSDRYRDCPKEGGEKELKKARFIGDQLLHSKKRKIENGIALSMDDSPSCDEKSPKKKHQALSRGSDEQTLAAPKRIVSVQTRSEGSMISDGCRWRKYGQKITSNNKLPRSYYRCAMGSDCPVKKQVQGCAEDPTIVMTTYKGEHTHPLSPLAMAVMHTSSNQLSDEELNTMNFLTGNQFIPISRISTSSAFPAITLDLTGSRPNPELQLQPAHLSEGCFQYLTPFSNDMGQVLDPQEQLHNYSSIIQESVASIKADPNFTAALAVAVAGFLSNLGAPVQGKPESPPATQCTGGSPKEVFV